MSDGFDTWWEQCSWVNAVLDADEGNPGPLVARLRSDAPLTQADRGLIADLLELRKLRPGPAITEADMRLDDAACEVRKLCAIQKNGLATIKRFRELSRMGTLNPSRVRRSASICGRATVMT